MSEKEKALLEIVITDLDWINENIEIPEELLETFANIYMNSTESLKRIINEN